MSENLMIFQLIILFIITIPRVCFYIRDVKACFSLDFFLLICFVTIYALTYVIAPNGIIIFYYKGIFVVVDLQCLKKNCSSYWIFISPEHVKLIIKWLTAKLRRRQDYHFWCLCLHVKAVLNSWFICTK